MRFSLPDALWGTAGKIFKLKGVSQSSNAAWTMPRRRTRGHAATRRIAATVRLTARAGGRHEAARVRGQAEGGGDPHGRTRRREEGVAYPPPRPLVRAKERRGGSILHRGGLQHRTVELAAEMERSWRWRGPATSRERYRLVHSKSSGGAGASSPGGADGRGRGEARRPRRRRAILVARRERHVAFAGSIASGRPRRRRARGVAGARPVLVARSIGFLRRLEIRRTLSQRRDALEPSESSMRPTRRLARAREEVGLSTEDSLAPRRRGGGRTITPTSSPTTSSWWISWSSGDDEGGSRRRRRARTLSHAARAAAAVAALDADRTWTARLSRKLRRRRRRRCPSRRRRRRCSESSGGRGRRTGGEPSTPATERSSPERLSP